jgi:hypothetical protein
MRHQGDLIQTELVRRSVETSCGFVRRGSVRNGLEMEKEWQREERNVK